MKRLTVAAIDAAALPHGLDGMDGEVVEETTPIQVSETGASGLFYKCIPRKAQAPKRAFDSVFRALSQGFCLSYDPPRLTLLFEKGQQTNNLHRAHEQQPTWGAKQQHLFATNLRVKAAIPRLVLKNTGGSTVTASPMSFPAPGAQVPGTKAEPENPRVIRSEYVTYDEGVITFKRLVG